MSSYEYPAFRRWEKPSAPRESCGGNTALFTLSILLGITLVVVIILIIVYATRGKNNSSSSVDIVAVQPTAQDFQQPLVLQGPLAQTDYKQVSVNQTAHLDKSSAPKSKPIEAQPGPQRRVLRAQAPAPCVTSASQTAGDSHITADQLLQLLNNKDGKTYGVVVVADFCGACKKTKQMIAKEVKDGHKLKLLRTEEVKKLDKALQQKLMDQYIPQFDIVGPNGHVTKVHTGSMPKADVEALIAELR